MLTTSTKPEYGSHEKKLPLDNCREYYLVLFEFYVKEISGDRVMEINQMFSIPTTVYFEFFDFVNDNDLKVTPVDRLFQPQKDIANDVEVFNVGKSVLFTVDFKITRNVKLIVKFIVKKQIPEDINLDLKDILVGTGELDLSDQYNALRLEMLQCCQQSAKTFDGQVPLFHDINEAGKLNVFVKMSNFGQTIITDFNAPMPQDSRTFVFGAQTIDQISMYKFRKVDSTDDLTQNSNKNVQGSVKDPMCQLEKHCEPLEEAMAVKEKDEGTEDVRMGTTTEKRSKNTTSKNPQKSNPHHSSESYGKPIVLKVSGLFDNGNDEKPTVTVTDESVAAKSGNSSNPSHDVFVLRIGKKGLVGIGEKSDIQLEMKTPKGPERRPPIRYETREMQTDVKEEEVKDRKKKPKKKKKKKKKN
ncbi:uncharacterized protein LOC116850595 [Odontomachus brunneus]|uniref:uncharacterized protein LOC116850595 n=1 Tax=Odontomachus brunneus TaxID=486640 RepID=UPI0013F1B6AD|nr:uncharacterized protein LOC116850595 [Odontomachus brunneus]